MLKNNKGFSLIELMAMILITTILIYPLMRSLVSNIQINDVLEKRRSASSISSSSLYSLDKMDYPAFLNLINDVSGDNYVELNLSACTSGDAEFISELSDQDASICVALFSTIWNNLVLNDAEYKIFLYNYNLPSDYVTSISSSGIPAEVIDEIIAARAEYVASTSYVNDTTTKTLNLTSNLLRVTVWIQYHDDPVSTVTLSGLIFNE